MENKTTEITWRPTGSRTWRVEIVRPEDREAAKRDEAAYRLLMNSQAPSIGMVCPTCGQSCGGAGPLGQLWPQMRNPFA